MHFIADFPPCDEKVVHDSETDSNNSSSCQSKIDQKSKQGSEEDRKRDKNCGDFTEGETNFCNERTSESFMKDKLPNRGAKKNCNESKKEGSVKEEKTTKCSTNNKCGSKKSYFFSYKLIALTLIALSITRNV